MGLTAPTESPPAQAVSPYPEPQRCSTPPERQALRDDLGYLLPIECRGRSGCLKTSGYDLLTCMS